MENKVTIYFEKQNKDKKAMCLKLRTIILKSFPDIKEEFRWGAVVYDEGRFYIAVVKQGVNLGFAIKGLSSSVKKLFNGSGKTMRHVKYECIKDINEEVVVNLLHLVKKKTVIPAY